MKLWQKINHFPGMYTIARKNTMALGLNQLRSLFPDQYNFYPRTWLLPADLQAFKRELRVRRSTFIVKPEASSQGRGIYLVRKADDLRAVEHSVAQEYLAEPFLIDGYKFDLRLYVLVAGCDPLRVFLHEEGLVRLATEPYHAPHKRNLKHACMHLTNYAVNKNNPDFVSNDCVDDYVGHKRSLSSFLLNLENEGHNVQQLWQQLCDLIVKTLLVVQPSLAHIYNSCQPADIANSSCFEILGFDVILDAALKPYLLEVNHSPSFTTESQLDYEIKSKVIAEALRVMNAGPEQRKQAEKVHRQLVQMRTTGAKSFKEVRELTKKKRTQYEAKRNKLEARFDVGYIKIYPTNEEYYQTFLSASQQIWDNFTARPRTGPSAPKKVRGPTKEHSPDSTSSRPSQDGRQPKVRKAPNTRTPQAKKSPYKVPVVPMKALKKPQKMAWL